MTNLAFHKIMEEQLDYCKSLLNVKEDEYVIDEDIDRFSFFIKAGMIQGCTMKQALAGMMAKHTISIYEMCQGGEYSYEKWVEKITDNINYLLLLRAMIEEEK